jgi:hypothetical protein
MPARSIGTSFVFYVVQMGTVIKCIHNLSLTQFVKNYVLNYSYKIQRSVANKHLILKNLQFIVISHVT